jgi:hypothetical protein
MTFIGMKQGTKGYLFMNKDNRIFVAATATFDESHFPRCKDDHQKDKEPKHHTSTNNKSQEFNPPVRDSFDFWKSPLELEDDRSSYYTDDSDEDEPNQDADSGKPSQVLRQSSKSSKDSSKESVKRERSKSTDIKGKGRALRDISVPPSRITRSISRRNTPLSTPLPISQPTSDDEEVRGRPRRIIKPKKTPGNIYGESRSLSQLITDDKKGLRAKSRLSSTKSRSGKGTPATTNLLQRTDSCD